MKKRISFMLMALVAMSMFFCGLCGLFRRQTPDRATWWMVLAGGLL